MKKITAFICVIIMCAAIVCSFAFTAFAESTAYEIDTLNMSIPIPDEMLVLTRDSSDNDPFFKTFKLNYETTMSKLNEGNIYLEAVTEDSALTLTVTMTKTEDSQKIGSYNSLSDEELTNIMKKLRENKTYKDASPVEYKGIKYICLNMSFKNGKKTVQAQQYNTVMNGENINITMQAAPGKKLKTADKEMLTDIVKDTTILDDNFFNRNRGFILYGAITLAAIAIVVVVFIFLFRYIRNPDRKHKILVHELAHEHKITETTQIPRKHIFNVTKPTNSFLTKYEPVGELGKRNKKKSQVVAEETRDIRSYSEPAPEQDEPETTMTYDDAPDEIVVPVEEVPADAAPVAKAPVEEVSVEEAPAEEAPVEEAPVEEAPAEEVPAEEAVKIEEELPEEEPEPVVEKAVQSEEEFDDTADYFDVDPEEGEMFSYEDIDTAVEDYTKAKKHRLSVNEDEDNEDIPSGWDTVKKILSAIGRGIAAFFRAVFIGIVFVATHLKYFFINLTRTIKRKHAQNKRRKAEEQRRREASERRRMEREAERARRRNNANRAAGDLVQVHSSYERRPQPSSRQRVDRPRSDRSRRAEDYRRSSQGRSSSQRRR
ncbi:MAG: hypothetical protein K6F88_06255 [Ruminococcus sp.]|nr:hypothetical protein [Ruminococcus sp.]